MADKSELLLVSVVIPNLHSPLIGAVLAALRVQSYPPCEVIVVGQDRYGQAQDDGLVRLLQTARPTAPAAARNLGARAAIGDIVLFLDSDCIAAPDLIERLVEAHRAGHTVVGGSVEIEPSGYWVLCDNLLVFAPVLSSQPAGARPSLPSLNLSIDRRLFTALGGFDERFPYAAGEDTDLSLRLRLRGHATMFEPAARIYHRPQRSSARAVWNHLRMFGRVHYDLQASYPDLLGSPLARLSPRWAGLILALMPLLALFDMLKLFAQQPALRHYPQAFWGMLWGKMGWYMGVAEVMLLRSQPVSAERSV